MDILFYLLNDTVIETVLINATNTTYGWINNTNIVNFISAPASNISVSISPASVYADKGYFTKAIMPSKDAYVINASGQQDKNHGAEPLLKINNQTKLIGWTWITFDLASIPKDATILNASLKLYAFNAPQSPQSVAIGAFHSSNASWGESEITWNNQPNESVVANPTDEINATQGTWLTWNVTNDVQSDFALDDYNSTWCLKYVNGSSAKAKDLHAHFWSKEYVDNETLRPKLEVTYDTGAKITLQAVDSGGNPVANNSWINVIANSSTAKFSTYGTNMTDVQLNSTGGYSILLNDTVIETVLINATNTTYGWINNTNIVNFISAPASNISVSASPTEVAANGFNYATITLQAVDNEWNAVSNNSFASLSVNSSTAKFSTSGENTTSIQLNSTGGYSILLNDTVIETVLINATNTTYGWINNTNIVNFISAPASNISVSASPTEVAANGFNYATITLQAVDNEWNAVSNNSFVSLSVSSSTAKFNTSGTNTTSIKLNNTGGYSLLLNDTEVETVRITAANTTYGWMNNTQTVDFTSYSNIIINEIMYAPTSTWGGYLNEWVEIYNNNTAAINISGWKFVEDSDRTLTLDQGSWDIQSGEYAIIAENSTKFKEFYSSYTGTLIDASGMTLNDDGEEIALKNSTTIIDNVNYTSYIGWANKNNKTLELNETGWYEGKVDGGTPGKINSISITPPNITAWNPVEETISNVEGESRSFNISIDQTVNVTWQINGTEVQTNESVTEANYTNTSAAAGYWNVSAIVSNVNGTDMQTWMWEVVNATYGLTLTADPTTRSVQESEDAKYTITIENTGNAPDTVNLTVINTSGTPDRVSLSADAVSLSVGASDDVILTVKGSAGTYLTTVKGTSTNDTSKNASVTVRTEVSAAPVYGVSISSNVTSKSVEKNENASYILTVENTGNRLDTFDLTLFTESGINASLSATTVTLNSGESTNVILTVNGTTAGDYITKVTASSQKSTKTETITLSTTILSTISLSVAPQSLAITTGGENATYMLTLNSTGNILHTYNLSASKPANANSTLTETTVTLNAGESASIELNVSSGTTGTYGVNVEVNTTSAGGVLEEASIATTTTVNPAPVYGVALSVDKTSQSVNKNENASYILTIQNTGNQQDTFNLTVINTMADSAILSGATTETLNAGASATRTLNVKNGTSGTYDVKVIAVSQEDPSKQDSITTSTLVTGYGVLITADTQSQTKKVGSSATYTLTIKNTGNTADSYALSVAKNSDTASLSSSGITNLAPGATDTVTLTVIDSAEGTYYASVTATSQGDTSKNNSIKVTTTFQEEDKYGVSLAIFPASKEVEKNEDAVFTIDVMNTGNRDDTYTLTTTTGTLGKNSLTIPAGDTKSTTLTVNGTEVKTYTSIVTVTSSQGPSDTKSVSITVIPAVSIDATPRSASLYLGNESSFTITIKNTGTMSHTYNLSVTNTSDIADLSTNSISLAKGKTADVTLTMNDSSGGLYTATVTATDQDDASKKASVMVTTSYQTVPVYGVDLEADATTRTIKSGKFALYVLTVTNLGNQPDKYNLTLINTRADTATLTKMVTSELSAGGSETITLNVSDTEGGSYEVKVIVESQNDPVKQDSITTTTNVLSYDVVIRGGGISTSDSTSKTAYAGTLTTYILTIENTGNAEDTYDLVLSSQTELDYASIPTTSVSLAAGASGEITLSVKDDTEGTYWARVNATSRGDSNKRDSVTVTTTFQSVPKYGVDMFISPTSKQVERNEDAVYTIDVINTGNRDDTYTLTTTLGTLGTSSLTISAGDTKSTTLTVHGTEIRTYTAIVTAASSHASETKSVSTAVIPAVSIDATPCSASLYLGNESSFIITIKNIGTMSHTYDLSVTNTSDIAELSASSVSLAKGKTADVTLTVNDSSEGIYTATVTATDHTNTSKKASVMVTASYQTVSVYGVELQADATTRTIKSGKYALYVLTVTNLGNRPDKFNLTLIYPMADTATLSKYVTSTISAGASETILLNVSDSEGGSYEVKVIAESQHDPGKQDSVTTTTHVLSYGVVIAPDSTSKTVCAGNLTTYILTIENTGNTEDIYDLVLSSPTGLDYASISTGSISLASGANAEVTLTVKADESETFSTEVKATSRGDSNKNDSVEVTTTFQDAAIYGVELSISPDTLTRLGFETSKQVERNEDAVYAINVMNTGNREDTYTLTTTIGALGASSLIIPAGDTKSTTLAVNGTEIKTYTAVVTATSQNNPTKTNPTKTKTSSVSTIVVPAVSIKATPASKTLLIGNESSFTITIKNTGTTSHTYNLSVTNTSDTADLSTSSVSLAKGDSTDVTLTMNASAEGMYTTAVTATDQGDSSKKASITVSTLYLEETVYGVDLRVDEETKTIEPGKCALYVLTVKNLGNKQDTFNLNITHNETPATLSKENVSLQPSGTVGDSATIKLNVTSDKTGEYAVNVKAVSQNDSSASDIIATTTKVAGTSGANTIVNSKIDETSTITNSAIIRSTIVRSLITNSTISDSEITHCSIYNSTVNDTALEDIKLENASVNAGNIFYGKITIEGITYEISEETAITNIVVSSDEVDSSVAGSGGDTTHLTLGTHTARFTIGNNRSYVGGSLKAQESSLPTEGTTRISLGTGEYINIDASDNIEEGMSRVKISVTYNDSGMSSMEEKRLRLNWYDETSDEWVRLVSAGNPSWCYDAGVNTEENYVWANVSHFSDYGTGGGGEVPEQQLGGVSVAIRPKMLNVNSDVPCNNFTIRVTNTQNFDDVIDLELTLSDIPPEYQANLSWFNWTADSIVVPSEASKDIGLMVNISSDPKGTGMYGFGIIAEATGGFSKDYGVVNITE